MTSNEKKLLKRLKNEGQISLKDNDDFEQNFASLCEMGYASKISEARGLLTSWGDASHLDDKFAITQHCRMALSTDWGKWGAVAGIFAIPLAILLWWCS